MMSMEISSQRLLEADGRAHGPKDAPQKDAPGGACDAASQERFERALEQGEEKDRGQGDGPSSTDAPPSPSSSPSPAALMESLFGQRMATADATASATLDEAGTMGDMVDTLVERILVSEPDTGNPEVRITLGDGVLSGTELSLSRAPDGQLFVRLFCSEFAAFQTAVGARDALRAALERSGENVRVEVTRSGGSDDAGGGNEGDSRRRSAMYGIGSDPD